MNPASPLVGPPLSCERVEATLSNVLDAGVCDPTRLLARHIITRTQGSLLRQFKGNVRQLGFPDRLLESCFLG